ncbi:YdcF family protein [Actinoplanes sp. NPDC049316]|uniref:YdcF family protein n=1 Tax=Actinoplanes sp. NPDC049316 TaxID=3154727 RepID=UPI00341A3D1F
MAVADDIADFVDASAPGLDRADLIFVFGSTLPDAIAPAARAFHDGLAPLIVLTGGPNRRNPTIVESDAHARLLQAQGIPPDRMLIERRSQTSRENVLFARPLIEERCDAPRTVIAVVKWWQRRQIHQLAAGLPCVERIYAATWNPPARADGRAYDRITWASSSDRPRIEAEFDYLTKLLSGGELPPLDRTEAGWTSTAPDARCWS